MKRYELKDKSRQAALEKALPGFKEALQRAYEYSEDGLKGNSRMVSSRFAENPEPFNWEWAISLPTSDLEIIEEYDPHAWNSYPEVTPPEGVLMRIEGQYAKRPELEYYGALMYLEGAWHFADTVEIADNVIVERFRPWNDEEAAK